jgi:NADPH-dependent 2,4-dienoyl-CoA reductase/sulfur reductase-like enzyme
MRFLIIGGSDAGISAALRARELSPETQIDLVLEDEFPNFSICGLPFFLSGETPDWKMLAHRTEFDGISVHRQHRAERIDAATHKVEVSYSAGKREFSYDKLLIGTGARPIRPNIPGWNLPGVFLLHTMKDSFAVRDYLESTKPKRAVIIGAGYIGLEMADALKHRGMEVVIASRPHTVLATVDAPFGELVQDELEQHGVMVCTGIDVREITTSGDSLHVSGNGFEEDCDMVLVAVGVIPNTQLGTEIGIQTGVKNALQVNRRMETTIPDVYVAGDCGETWHRMLSRNTYLPLGTTAHKQGRIAGENALGGNREFAGSLGTQVVKIFNLVIARTGFRQDEAVTEGIEAATHEVVVDDHKAYYPGATPIRCRVTGDVKSGRLLGAQIMGSWGAEVSKRNNIFAAALFNEMTIEYVSDLDLSYTPPLSSPWDPVQMACQAWNAEHGRQF